MSVRQPAVAGTFYNANAEELQQEIQAFLANIQEAPPKAAPAMLIVPHAGYVYSGQIAAFAYAQLKGHEDAYNRVIVLGPSHRVLLEGIAISSDNRFETPLGQIHCDTSAIARLSNLPFVAYRHDAHLLEHSLEVQLPFLQTLLGEFELIPLVVGGIDPPQLIAALESIWDEKTLLVVSTDLSHFHRDAPARAIDENTIHKILQYDPDIEGFEACGHFPLAGALGFAQQRGWDIQLLTKGNSGDIFGDKSRVVGYASFSLNSTQAA
ncbi:AmmeMemoRadiSam system protein B [Reinekea marinisedimentorum]|uniref:MEMO1 family protein BCF53_108193 n=1 Tax=Reinekea marinisedimentorum TaxID=230495 RepID=A0A4R3I7H5_9GAMM|nr:AmmeMemoRadiSam system protein B [Reinekea marinisedimentorum]TCS40824.1 hypothetical protein BCF53_108193 [Reinekea marinisedimentorum]